MRTSGHLKDLERMKALNDVKPNDRNGFPFLDANALLTML